MRFMDFSSWQTILASVLGLALFALIGVGVRVLMMLTIQQRQQRLNRQINERLRTLMAAYKVLGGAFTGKLTVDPRSRRDYARLSRAGDASAAPDGSPVAGASEADAGITLAPSAQRASEVAQGTAPATEGTGSVLTGETITQEHMVLRDDAPAGGRPLSPLVIERHLQMRDAVEAALSDILLLGTEEHVRLAGKAAAEMAQGHVIHTAELVVSLRNYIREALDLEKIPADAVIPAQGPTRVPAAPARGANRGDAGSDERARAGGAGGMGGGGMGGGGMGGMGMGAGMGMGRRPQDP